MRGRDSGLPDYNTVRKCFHLDPIQSWEDINPQLFADKPDLVNEVKELYGGNLMNVDLWVCVCVCVCICIYPGPELHLSGPVSVSIFVQFYFQLYILYHYNFLQSTPSIYTSLGKTVNFFLYHSSKFLFAFFFLSPQISRLSYSSLL